MYQLMYRFDKDLIQLSVECVRLHPEADLDDTLANNVAVLKLSYSQAPAGVVDPRGSSVRGVVGLREFVPADQPEQLATGVLTKISSSRDCTLPAFYINTVCLPLDEEQFSGHDDDCFVAAWGSDPYTQGGQREVHLRLLSRRECQDKLRPEFARRQYDGWSPQPSELCAQGERGEDTCQGEGGSPLVCLDKARDQYFAVGLVNYGFDCYQDIPAVYVNLADPVVKNFIISAIDDQVCK